MDLYKGLAIKIFKYITGVNIFVPTFENHERNFMLVYFIVWLEIWKIYFFHDNNFEVGISESSIHHAFNPYKAIEELIRISTKYVIIYHEAVNSLIIKIALVLGLIDILSSISKHAKSR